MGGSPSANASASTRGTSERWTLSGRQFACWSSTATSAKRRRPNTTGRPSEPLRQQSESTRGGIVTRAVLHILHTEMEKTKIEPERTAGGVATRRRHGCSNWYELARASSKCSLRQSICKTCKNPAAWSRQAVFCIFCIRKRANDRKLTPRLCPLPNAPAAPRLPPEAVPISWAQWKASALNHLFQQQGVVGQPGRIIAATVTHGETGVRGGRIGSA